MAKPNVKDNIIRDLYAALDNEVKCNHVYPSLAYRLASVQILEICKKLGYGKSKVSETE